MKKLILFLMFIVFISSVYSVNDEGLLECYDFEETTGEVKGFLDNHNGTATGVQRGVEGKINNSFEYDGVNDVVDVPHDVALNFGTGSFSYEAWILLNNTGVLEMIVVKQQSGGDFTGFYLFRHNTDQFRLQITDTSADGINSGVYTTLNEWIHVIATRNDTGGVAIYINGVLNNTGINSKDGDNAESMRFGLNAQNGQDFIGKIDIVRIYDTYINESRALSLFNNGTGRDCINTNEIPLPSMSINTNLINNTQNFSSSNLFITWNATFTNTLIYNANCSLYVNDVLTSFNETSDLTNNLYYNYVVPQASQWFNFSINCSNHETNDNTIKYYYNIDMINPIINYDWINNSIYTLDQSTIHTYTFNDSNLEWIEINYTDSNGNIFDSMTWLIQDISTETYTMAINLTNRNVGINYTATISSGDSHTLYIDIPISWTKFSQGKWKGINFTDKFYMASKNKSMIEDFYLTYNVDSYLMKFKFNDLLPFTLDIYTKKKIRLLNNSEYQGHLIIGKKWGMDLESEDVEDFSIVKISDNRYRIKFTPLYYDVMFNSIFALNIQTIQLQYDVVSADTLLLQQILAVEEENLQTNQDINEGIKMTYLTILLIVVIILYVFNLLVFRSAWFGILLFCITIVLHAMFIREESLLYLISDMVAIGLFMDLMIWDSETEITSLSGVLDK